MPFLPPNQQRQSTEGKLFHRLSQQKANAIMTFIMVVMILFTESTAVLN